MTQIKNTDKARKLSAWGPTTSYHVSDKEFHYYFQTGSFQGPTASIDLVSRVSLCQIFISVAEIS